MVDIQSGRAKACSYDSTFTRKSLIIGILLLGAWLRFHALVRDVRFQPDEALFSTFARAAAINGEWMLPGALDKPPLAIYANALAVIFVGESEFAARLPGTLASMVLLAVMYRLGRDMYGVTRFNYLWQRLPHPLTPSPLRREGEPAKLYNRALTVKARDGVPMMALLLMAVSPYAIAFSATALTDGLMLLLMVLALSMAVRDRWAWSGLWLGLACASKQQAVFYLPLIALVGWATAIRFGMRKGRPSRSPLQSAIVRFGIAFGVCVSGLLVWDIARGGTSLFALAAVNNDPARLIRANEILPRLAAWLTYGQGLIGAGWLTAILVGLALVRLLVRVVRETRRRDVLVDVLLLVWLAGYGVLHWLVAFNTYDRYLLPMLPVVVLLVARGLNFKKGRSGRSPLHIVIAVILVVGAVNTRTKINNLGEQYAGIDALADYLNSKPVATVIYDRWLGWELGYYLGEWTDKRRVYYPTPDTLAEGALSLCEIGVRYLPAPAQQPIQPYLEALREAGFRVELDNEIAGFVVYAITPAWADASDAATSSPGLSESCGGEQP